MLCKTHAAPRRNQRATNPGWWLGVKSTSWTQASFYKPMETCKFQLLLVIDQQAVCDGFQLFVRGGLLQENLVPGDSDSSRGTFGCQACTNWPRRVDTNLAMVDVACISASVGSGRAPEGGN